MAALTRQPWFGVAAAVCGGLLVVAAIPLAGVLLFSVLDNEGQTIAPDADGVTAPAAEQLRPDERIEGGVIITPDPEAEISNFSTSGWSTDFTRHTVPYEEIHRGGPPKDGIPPIDNPKFVSNEEAAGFLAGQEPVALVSLNGEAKAYPLQILIWHEIVNDEIGGEPVAVTYCPLCNTALSFARTFEGGVLDFGTTGNLRFSDLVMYDRQTESWWQQIGGEGIIGEHAGKQLEVVPTSIVSFEDFVAAHPDGLVLSRDTGFEREYGATPYLGYDSSENPFLYGGPEDHRLPATERVVSLTLNDEAAAYPFSVLQEELVVNDDVGGEPVVIFFKPGTTSALDQPLIADSREVGSGVAYSRTVGGMNLTFRADGDDFVDEETGSTWNIAGQATDGRLAGSQLEPLVHANHFWFAWAVFRPDTRIYQP
jgi:Protein of unknown function (DUF3179)